MQLAELDAPGTEYALQRDRYSPVSRATLVGIVKLDRDEDSVHPKSRRYAEMMVTDGPFALTFEDARDKANWKKQRTVRVSGKVILSTWEEYERFERERAANRESHEQAKAAAVARCTEARQRTAALGIDVGERDVAENAGLQQAFGRWWESHLMVPVEAYEALLAKAEDKRGTFLKSKDPPDAQRLADAGMPEGYMAEVETYGVIDPGPDGSMRSRVRPAAQRVSVTRDGVEVADRVIPIGEKDWMRHAVELAKDNAAHEHELAS